MSQVIRWVVALRPEANPLIDRFSMNPLKGIRSPFPIYTDSEGLHELIISGVGKANAAAATAFLAGIQPLDGRVAGWINVGVAGGCLDSFGETGLASQITDSGSGRSWYPAATWPRKYDLPRVTVLTLDQPSQEYPEDHSRFDMEAAGYYSTALKFASVETAQVLKVVSDDPGHPISDLNKELVQNLIRNCLDSATDWLAAFATVLDGESTRLSDPGDYAKILEAFHFSETRKHQLRRLLQQRGAQGLPEWEDVSLLNAVCRNAAECLDFLKRDLNWGS